MNQCNLIVNLINHQIKNQLGQWIPATPIHGSIVVNTGDLLNSWSGGLFASTVRKLQQFWLCSQIFNDI